MFAEIQRADTVGTFQIESRAQMQSLLRTKPETIDDLTVQVALVRPGPIQGKAVHPYIEHRRRLREDPSFVYPVDHEALREPLRSTLGVVVFQDQVLDVAIALAGFTVGEAEGLRRAMSRKRSRAALESHRVRFIEGAVRNGVAEKVADLVYDKLVGFSGFGFPKSHAAAFGLLAYQSQWLRHHYPAEFLCSLLNAQPMGFYPPASLVRDAQRRGVEVHSPDVNLSEALLLAHARPTSEAGNHRTLRRRCASVSRTSSRWERTTLRPSSQSGSRTGPTVTSETSHGASRSRRTVSWRSSRVVRVTGSGQSVAIFSGSSASPPDRPPFRGRRCTAKQLTLSLDPTAATPSSPDLTRWERMAADYRLTGLSVGVHPLLLLRPHLPGGTLRSDELHRAAHRSNVAYAGLAIARQRPSTANGIVFMLLEDECGQVNLIVPKDVYERHRAIVRNESLLLAHGRYERVGENRNILVSSIETLAAARPASRRSRCGRGTPTCAPLRWPLIAGASPSDRGLPPMYSATGSNPSRVYDGDAPRRCRHGR